MSSLRSILGRLETLDKELSPPGGGDTEDAELDPFSRLKKQCARQVADIRKTITERDELLEKSGTSSKDSVEMSARIRSQIRSVKENVAKLRQIQEDADKKSAKKKKGAAAPGELDARHEYIDLVNKHITECEQLEKKRYGHSAAASSKPDLMIKAVKRTAVVTDLKDLDDPELDAGLKLLAQKDKELDTDLDEISVGVGRLKAIALDMSEEVKMQNVMIEEISDKVDAATGHLQDLNVKLKSVLDEQGGATRFIIIAVLLILVLAVAAYAYKIIAKK